jgi:hypothetical protein
MTEMREKIARAIGDNMSYEIRESYAYDTYAELTGIDAAADAVLALIEPVIEERDKWKQRAFELECRFGDLKGVYVERAALSPKSKKQDG